MKQQSVVRSKSFAFALKIVKVANILNGEKQYVIAKQLLKCGTSIGANIVEAQDAQSKPDFISKMSIALKEARETQYWLYLIGSSSILPADSLHPLIFEIQELIALLTAILKTSRLNISK